MTKRVLSFILIMLGFSVSSEWIEITNFYSSEQIYTDLKKNWPSFGYTAKVKEDGKYDVAYMWDHKAQIFPCGPLKCWLVAYKGRKELSIYHFINNDGSNTKQSASNSSIDSEIKVKVKNGRPQFPIEEGVDSLLPPRGIERFDLIVGANGQFFDQSQPMGHEGEYGPIYDLAIAIEKAQTVGKISLLIKKPGEPEGKRPRSVTVKLDKLPRFAKNFPFKCQRSQLIEKELMELFANDEQNKLSNGISFPLIGLAMLASGDKNYLPTIERYVTHLNTKFVYDADKDAIVTRHQNSSWKSGFTLIFLSEYFWATGDLTVFPVIQRLAYDVDEFHQNAFGSAGHGKGGIGTYYTISFGPPNGLNAFGAALAEKCGAKVNSAAYENYWHSMTREMLERVKTGNNDYTFSVDDDKDYFNGYSHYTFEKPLEKSVRNLQSINTSTAALALMFSKYKNPEVRKLALKLHDALVYSYKTHSYVHTTPVMGHFFSQLALNAFDNNRPLNSRVIDTFNEPYALKYAGTVKKGKNERQKLEKLTSRQAWRKIMDYRKYLLIHSRFDKDTYFYFIPRCQNHGRWGGDFYANLQGSGLYNLLGLVVSDERNLMMYGNKMPCWLVSKSSSEAKVKYQKVKKYLDGYHRKYADFMMKQAMFLYNGGEDAELLKEKSAENVQKRKIYQLLAYEQLGKICENYRNLPVSRDADNFRLKIAKKFGGKKGIEQELKNLDGLRKIDYACSLHERKDRKPFLSLRKNILKYVEQTYQNCPASKIAAEEYARTQKLEEEMGEEDQLKLEESSPLYVPRKVPAVDVIQMEQK